MFGGEYKSSGFKSSQWDVLKVTSICEYSKKIPVSIKIQKHYIITRWNSNELTNREFRESLKSFDINT